MTKFLKFKTRSNGIVLMSANQNSQIYSNGASDGYQRVYFSPGWNQTITLIYQGPYYFSGTETGTTTNRLIDSSADFVAAGVQPGDYVISLTGNLGANSFPVVSVISPTELSFASWTPVAGALYSIYRPSEALKIMDSFTDAISEALSTKWTEPIIDVELPSGLAISHYNYS